MAASDLKNLGLKYKWGLGEDGWNTGHDLNLLILDALCQSVIVNATTTTPPVSPVDGSAYIPATGASGDWSSLVGKIAIYDKGTWVGITPKEGWVVYNAATGNYLKYSGSSWLIDPFSNNKGVDVRSYGGTSGGSTESNTTAFSSAVSAAVANGCKRVIIPFDSWAVTTDTDAQNCIIVGNGTTSLSGMIGVAKYDGCVINTSKQDYIANHPVPPIDRAMKLVKVVDANTIRVLVEKSTTGYCYLTLKNNSTTNGNDSLGVTGTDATMWRITSIQDAVEAVVGITTQSGSSGTWTVSPLTTDIPSFTSGTDYEYSRSTTIGAWAEYTVTVPIDGKLSITFLESSSASSDVTVSVDTVPIDSNFSTVSSTTRRVTRTYDVKPGSHTIKIQNNTVGSTGLNIVGIYFSQLRNARNDIAYDSYGVYRNSAYLDPVIQSSANDLVLKDYNCTVTGSTTGPGIYGGSYHGGESGISTVLLVNGVSSTISSGNLFVGSSVEFQQSCTITWSGSKPACTYSGASVDVRTRTNFIIGGYTHQSTVTGNFTARELYTTLMGANENFDAITFPQYKVLSTIPDTSYTYLGQNNSVEYYYSSTGQRFRITHSQFTCPDSKNGGAYIWRVVGSYCKYYNPWIWRGKRDITSISAVNIVQSS